MEAPGLDNPPAGGYNSKKRRPPMGGEEDDDMEQEILTGGRVTAQVVRKGELVHRTP